MNPRIFRDNASSLTLPKSFNSGDFRGLEFLETIPLPFCAIFLYWSLCPHNDSKAVFQIKFQVFMNCTLKVQNRFISFEEK